MNKPYITPTVFSSGNRLYSLFEKENWLILGCNYKQYINRTPRQSNKLILYKVCSALGDNYRIQLLLQLQKHPEQSIKELSTTFNLSISTISHHMKILLENNLIFINQHSKVSTYSINEDIFSKLSSIFAFIQKGELSYENLEETFASGDTSPTT